jgi:hypothetical protein
LAGNSRPIAPAAAGVQGRQRLDHNLPHAQDLAVLLDGGPSPAGPRVRLQGVVEHEVLRPGLHRHRHQRRQVTAIDKQRAGT